ncbi:Protein-disulfide isomerase [Promicromonospora umidemergens]|uniref:Thioredoxin domain-containing protein n=1 Tax=Promicromonospora umidemergens TaxID=629679 RepID=A0ABP8XZJ1_9MICO|nr:Protein-disulfide isomerase [Promicromonospora umidemergens]
MSNKRPTTNRPVNKRPAAKGPAPKRSAKPRLTSQRLLQIVLLVGVLALIGILVAAILSSEPETPASDAQVVRENSHVLNQASDEKAVLVEFLDFECEVCRAYYPTVEQLREEHADELTLVMRYFPIPGHTNSTTAAVAVEAAAGQGQLEPMYQRMYETQAEWGESQDTKADVFRGFAQDLRLDMDAFDTAVTDPATTERVQADFEEGRALGVEGTPTFFLDGERLEVETPDDLIQAVQAAIEE